MLAGLLSDLGSELDIHLEFDASWTFIWSAMLAELLSGIGSEPDFNLESDAS